ncbi:tyrosine-type recombinase/integrase [Flavobacterium sp.]|uniref:tyrosine-type recombinase/integrase n=1 Tax=Flavobacterium sp. TaxID=239 RepID=UPI0039E27CD6
MATLKIILYKYRAKKDGTFPLALRITKDRKPSYIFLEYAIKEEDWNEEKEAVRSSHPNSKQLNNFLLQKKAEANDRIIETETQQNQVSVSAIRQKIKPKATATFFAQAQHYLGTNRAAGSYNAYFANTSRLKVFKEFLGDKDVAFSDITISLLERYKGYLSGIRKNSERTIANHLMLIRAIYSQAIKENVIDAKFYPFGADKVSIKRLSSAKIGLDLDDIAKLEAVALDNSAHDLARNLWLTSYYFAGMRISDVLRLRWADIKSGRLYYTMGKNNKPGSIVVHEKARLILDKYEAQKKSDDDLVFPNLTGVKDFKDKFEVKKKIAYHVNRTNKVLKDIVAPAAEINGKITTHIARHSFATIAADKIPVQMLQKLYRHSDLRTTVGYQNNFIHKDADDALMFVIG